MTTTAQPTTTVGLAARLESLQLPTPAGLVTVLLTPEDGVVRAAGFCPPEALQARLLPALSVRRTTATPARGPVADAVTSYGDGDPTALDTVLVDQPGGPFHQLAWQAMRAVPAGSTTSYAGLAAAAGRTTAVRAAGSSCARNLIALFVPCHRVLRSDGSLGGYLYGLHVKEQLLRHEAR